MSTLSERSLRRRFLTLTAMRWFPGGLTMPVLVLLMQARGIDLGTTGTLFALYSVLVAACELPTGGLADVIGRRPVVIASAVLNVVAFAGFALAHGTGGFAAAMVAFAVGRALSSGPLEAWYVDAVHAIDPATDLRPALGRKGLVSSVSIGFGSIIGGSLPAVAGHLAPRLATRGDSVLLTITVPVWCSAGLLALSAVLTPLLMSSDRTAGPASVPRPGVRAVLADVPRAVGSGLSIARSDAGARAILLACAAVGLAISATELIAPPYFAALVGDRSRATALYGVLLTVVFVASGMGSALGPMLARGVRGSLRGSAAACVLGAAGYALLGVTGGIVAAVVGYVGVYVVLGAADPLITEQLHHRVTSRERSTMLSVESMAQMAGGTAGALLVPRLVDGTHFAAGWWACAAGLLVAAALTVRVKDRRPGAADAEAPEVAGSSPVLGPLDGPAPALGRATQP